MRDGTVQACGEKVRHLRLVGGLTQEELADRMGCAKRTVENLEAGKPVFARLLRDAATALGTSTIELLKSPSDESAVSTSSALVDSGTSPPMPSLLVGRDVVIAELIGRLSVASADESRPVTQVLTAVRGWPGIGKTTIARAIAHHPKVSSLFTDGVLWVSLGPSPLTANHLHAWCQAIGLELLATSTEDEMSKRLVGALRNRKMLLIVDDVWDSRHATPFLVGGRNCATMLTTRLTFVAESLSSTPDDVYRLAPLSDEDSLTLLGELAPSAVKTDRDSCLALARELEGLPLALQVAGRLLRAEHGRGFGVTELLKGLRSDIGRLLDTPAPPDVEADASKVSPTMAALLKRSTDSLDPAIRKRFAYLAPFAPRPAVFEFDDLKAVWRADDASTRETIATLVDRGLLETVDEGTYQIHQVLVQFAKTLWKRR